MKSEQMRNEERTKKKRKIETIGSPKRLTFVTSKISVFRKDPKCTQNKQRNGSVTVFIPRDSAFLGFVERDLSCELAFWGERSILSGREREREIGGKAL